MTVTEFRKAISLLPPDAPVIDSGKWYATQRQHWIGWLREYGGPGAYGRVAQVQRDARFAYNHILEWRMLLYLAHALRFSRDEVDRARRAAECSTSMQGGAAAVRRHFPWELIESRLRRVLSKSRKA